MALADDIRGDIKDTLSILDDTNEVVSEDPSNHPSANRIKIGPEVVYGLEEVRKNGTIISDTDYTWHQFGPFVTIDTGVSKGDIIYIEYQRYFSDGTIDTDINEVDRHLKGQLSPYYDPNKLENSPTYQALVQDWVIGRLGKRLVQGPSLDSAKYRDAAERVEDAKSFLKLVKRGGANLLDDSLEELARTTGSLVGGTQNLDESDIKKREDILEDLKDHYDDRIVNFLGGRDRYDIV